ncbi:MAG: NUDIX domain-containing protein [Acidimicrobiia bacterium]|nr:NUDIX domain-containing protein [Acidimicrobiia bacterium]
MSSRDVCLTRSQEVLCLRELGLIATTEVSSGGVGGFTLRGVAEAKIGPPQRTALISGSMSWRPHPDLVHTVRGCIGSVLCETAEARFERDAWLAILESDPGTLTREGNPAHFTASALPVSQNLDMVCLVLHRRIGLWVQPGGHFEPDDHSVWDAALRETLEETGLSGTVSSKPIDTSRHPAPCGVGDWHLDLRFLLVVDEDQPDDEQLTLSEESHDVGWFPVDDLPEQIVPDLVATVSGLQEVR